MASCFQITQFDFMNHFIHKPRSWCPRFLHSIQKNPDIHISFKSQENLFYFCFRLDGKAKFHQMLFLISFPADPGLWKAVCPFPIPCLFPDFIINFQNFFFFFPFSSVQPVLCLIQKKDIIFLQMICRYRRKIPLTNQLPFFLGFF